MWQSIVDTIKDLNVQWSKLSMSKRVGALTLALIIAVCLLTFGAWVGEKSYAPLYTDLQPENSIALVKFLQQERIPYLVGDEGKTVSIPPEFVQQTLMKLAIQGMPAGNKPGLEIFDKESFGTSSYVQRINYVRALQGELTRTISTLRAVRKSTVHISMPPKTSFLETVEEPKASVVIELHPGAEGDFGVEFEAGLRHGSRSSQRAKPPAANRGRRCACAEALRYRSLADAGHAVAASAAALPHRAGVADGRGGDGATGVGARFGLDDGLRGFGGDEDALLRDGFGHGAGGDRGAALLPAVRRGLEH
jgi:hypothetical protein